MINLYDIHQAANGQFFGERAATLFTDFCLDPAAIEENQLFVALRTDQGDTHYYIEEAIQNGAAGILCVDPPTCDTTGVSVLMVDDTVDGLVQWAQQVLQKLPVKPIVVVGSATKSATVDAISHVLSTRYEVLRGDVNVSGKLSVPLSLPRLTAQHDFVVFKIMPSVPSEMSQMLEAINPHIGVITNVDCVHPANFADCDAYIHEIATVTEYLSQDDFLIINYDDEQVRQMTAHSTSQAQLRTIGTDRFGADLLAFNVKVGLERVGFDLRYGDERFVAKWSPIVGKHHLYSILSAIQVGLCADISVSDALASLTNLGTLPGRMALLDGINGSILIDDSYAGSHASTIDALNWLKEIRDDGQRTIFVLGDMENSGRNNRFAHRSIGQYVADIADIIVTQGLNAALTARSSVDSGKDVADVRITYSTQDTITAVKSLGITSDDIILIKGSVRAGMEDVVAGLLENPERDSSLLVRQQRRNRDENTFLRPSWIDIDVDAIANNVRIIKSHIGDVELMAVVKADAYGHGAVMVARTALANGATQLAVASIAEAIELRDAGIRAPILVMTYAPAQTVRQAHQLDITLTVYDVEQAEQYDRVARTLSGKLKVHIKIDSGMGRLGILADEAMRAFRLFNALNNLEVEGVYTHFSSAEDDPDYTAYQVETFLEAIRPLRAAGIRVKYTHAANSPGTLASTDNHFNLVRPGVMLYGLPPSEETPLYEGMRPAMSWKTSVIQVKLFPAGHPIGYGRTYVTSDEELIAFLPVGYADGFRRSPNTWEYVLIKGQRAPVVGRISMEKVAVSVTHISNVRAGDEVVLLGKQGNEEITATMIADWLGTINYEVVSNILARVPRR